MSGSAQVSRAAAFLLAILYFAKSVYGKTKMQKLAFLVQQECKAQSLHGFFTFQPYYYGPFSAAISEKMKELESRGLIRVAARATGKFDKPAVAVEYVATVEGMAIGERFVKGLPPAAVKEFETLVVRYNFMSLASMLEYTYRNYPETARRSVWQYPD